MIKTLAIAALEKLLNHYCALDPETYQAMQALAGKIVCLELTDVRQKIFFIFTTQKIRLAGRYAGSANTYIKGNIIGIVQSMRANDSAAAASTIEVEGDVELGQQLRRILNNMSVPWEEYLSRCFGDSVAHQISNVAHKTAQWNQAAITAWERNLREYLQEEARLLPTRIEVEDFYQAVGECRNDLARIEARFQRLFSAKK